MMNHLSKAALAAVVLMTGCSQAYGMDVGPRGGMVLSDDGRFSLEIPPGALDQEVEITIDQVECEQPEAVGPCYEVGPVGMPLLFPAMVTYELDPDTLDEIDVDEIAVLTEREEDWKPLADHTVDASDEVVVASAVYLSAYAVVLKR